MLRAGLHQYLHKNIHATVGQLRAFPNLIHEPFCLDCFGSCSQNPDASAQLPLGTKKMEAASPTISRLKRKLEQHSGKQQFHGSNSTCLQIGTSRSPAVSSNFHHYHPAQQWCRLGSFSVGHKFCPLLFSSNFKGTMGSIPENLRHLDEQLIFSSAICFCVLSSPCNSGYCAQLVWRSSSFCRQVEKSTSTA